MVPIHETDLIGERFSTPRAQWENYELWEKVELRQRKKKRLFVLLTALVSIGLLSIPTWIESRPKWQARRIARGLAQEINRMKRDAAIEHASYRISFPASGELEYRVDRVPRCEAGPGALARVGSLAPLGGGEKFKLLTPTEGQKLEIPGVVTSFCYDPVKGPSGHSTSTDVSGFAFISVKDLAEERVDRVSILLLQGESAEISFN